ncbi:MAG TPA: YoaK family protein [Pseudolabrys sp.]|nr:YoaK family protein [Pseudolabrys sp.]
MAAGLAMIAGFVDAYGIVTYGTYLSFMSGNTTQTGYRIGQGNFAAAVPAVVAIVFFFGGSFAGALVADYARLRARRLVFGMVAAALALIIGLTQLGLSSGGVHIALISFAMGFMNIALSKVGAESVSLTFVTGALSKLGLHLALAARRAPLPDSQGSWDTQMHRALILAGIWGAFLAGALLSGVATPRFGVWVLLFPTVILAALAAFDRPVSAAVARRSKAIADQGS